MNQKATDSVSKMARKQGGLVIKTLRSMNKLTQHALAAKAGLEYYTFISQIESGVGKIPPQKLRAFALALNCNPKKFARELLKFYDPHTFEVLFDAERTEPTDYKALMHE